MSPPPQSIADVMFEDERGLYPQQLLAGCADALVLFAAGFYGRQDAVWICDAGLDATCVDLDEARLARMAALYPAGWEYVQADAFAYAVDVVGRRVWDLVSLDPPTDLFAKVARHTALWGRLARKAIIVGCGRDAPHTPRSWRTAGMIRRSSYCGGVYWAMFARDAQ